MWGVVSALARLCPPEQAHLLAVRALQAGLGPHPRLDDIPVCFAGLTARSPIGLAAGFDKDAQAIHGCFRLGFGYVEIGTVPPRPQPGNPRPRLFRLAEDGAVINRFGFNSSGMDAAAKNLSSMRQKQAAGPVGVNIGANKDSDDQIQDYYLTARRLSPFADYLTVNLSSPNTPGLRRLQHDENLTLTLNAVAAGCTEAERDVPVLVKLAPDLDQHSLSRILDTGLKAGANGFILTNTTIDRPDGLKSASKDEAGGLSGVPLKAKALHILSVARQHLAASGRQDVPLIGVGGISTAEDVYARILTGASAIQLYTALALTGPHIVADLHQGVARMLDAEGTTIEALRGQITDPVQAERHAQHILKIAIG